MNNKSYLKTEAIKTLANTRIMDLICFPSPFQGTNGKSAFPNQAYDILAPDYIFTYIETKCLRHNI